MEMIIIYWDCTLQYTRRHSDTLWDPHVAAYVSYPRVIKRRIFNCHVWLPWEILNHLISYLWITAFSASRNKRKPIEKVYEIVIFDCRIPSDWFLLYQLYMIFVFLSYYTNCYHITSTTQLLYPRICCKIAPLPNISWRTQWGRPFQNALLFPHVYLVESTSLTTIINQNHW